MIDPLGRAGGGVGSQRSILPRGVLPGQDASCLLLPVGAGSVILAYRVVVMCVCAYVSSHGYGIGDAHGPCTGLALHLRRTWAPRPQEPADVVSRCPVPGFIRGHVFDFAVFDARWCVGGVYGADGHAWLPEGPCCAWPCVLKADKKASLVQSVVVAHPCSMRQCVGAPLPVCVCLPLLLYAAWPLLRYPSRMLPHRFKWAQQA